MTVNKTYSQGRLVKYGRDHFRSIIELFVKSLRISFSTLHFIFTVFLLLSANVAEAQDFERKGQRWMIGWQPGFFYAQGKERYPGTAKYNLLLLESYIDIGYFINKKIMIGGCAGHSFKAFGNAMEYPDLYHLGYFFRYYPFEGDPGMKMESNFCEKCVTLRVRPYFQWRHTLTNGQIRNGRNIGLDHLGVHRLDAVGGTAIRIRKNFFFDIGFGVRNSFNTDQGFSFSHVHSLEYFFGYSKKKENINNPLCNATLLQGVFGCKKTTKETKLSSSPKGVMLGSSFTYISDDSFNGTANGKFRESSWNINMAAFLPKRFRAGINTVQIFTQGPLGNQEKHFIAGGMLQHELSLSKKDFFLIETGLMSGNYCTCGGEDPIKKEGLLYLDIGAAIELHIIAQLYFDLGFNVYRILNDVEGKYAYTQYIVGLNYLIGRR